MDSPTPKEGVRMRRVSVDAMNKKTVLMRTKAGESRVARSMQTLSRSMFQINMMSTSQGVLKAKQAFLELVSGRKGRLPTSDDLSKEGGLIWDKIQTSLDGKPLNLCIAEIDFSDLKDYDVVEEADASGEKVPGGGPPPPPPGAPPGPPPPPGPTASPTGAPVPSIDSTKKTVKIYWNSINNIRGDTLWDNLPKVEMDREKFETLFQIKEIVKQKSEIAEKPKELNILDAKRSNAINFAIRRLPPAGGLEDTILHMDCTVMDKEAVEKLQSLIPTEEELERIKDAMADNPGIPLGKAENFLHTLGKIPFLEGRLNLWMFKINFSVMEKDICEPYAWLKEGIDILSTNPTFLTIINVTLQLGNILNKTSKPGFHLDSLNKLSSVKDTDTKKSLLYHVATSVMSVLPDASDLYGDVSALIQVSKVDFDELETNLKRLEYECKQSLGSIKLATKFDVETEKMVSEFLSDAAERIIGMKKVNQLVMAKYSGFLDWLGIPKGQHADFKPNRLGTVVANFAIEYRATVLNIEEDLAKEKGDMMKTAIEVKPLAKKRIKSGFKLFGR